MTDQRPDGSGQFERAAREAFDASIEALDATTRSRLDRARQRAVAATRNDRRAATNRWPLWVPAGALTAAAVIATVLLLRTSPDQPGLASDPAPSIEPVDMLVAGDDLALAAEADLDFFALVELEADSVDATGSTS